MGHVLGVESVALTTSPVVISNRQHAAHHQSMANLAWGVSTSPASISGLKNKKVPVESHAPPS